MGAIVRRRKTYWAGVKKGKPAAERGEPEVAEEKNAGRERISRRGSAFIGIP